MLVLAALFTVVDCNGPAFPDRDGRAYLEKHKYPQALVDPVVNGKPLQHDQVIQFSKCRSTDVRFLVGKNPTLRPEEIDFFIGDADDYARSGAAHNRSLTVEQMERLFRDDSHTVYASLAENPSVPEEMLLRLHAERRPGLVFFAMNPKCPPKIVDEIRHSDDQLAKQWLEIMKNPQSEHDGAANGNQPIRLETNSTSPAAGSRRCPFRWPP